MIDVKKAIMSWAHYEDCDEEQFQYCDKYIGCEIATYNKGSGKYITECSVFKDENTGKHYQLEVVRTNSGYWSDSETISAACFEVVPKEVVSIVWEKVDG